MTKLLEIRNSIGVYVDVTEKIEKGSFVVNRTRIAPKRGRSPIAGAGYAGQVAQKRELSASANPLTQDAAEDLLELIRPEYVYVNYLDPEIGWRRGVKCYSGNEPATAARIRGGVVYWEGISFQLSEV